MPPTSVADQKGSVPFALNAAGSSLGSFGAEATSAVAFVAAASVWFSGPAAIAAFSTAFAALSSVVSAGSGHFARDRAAFAASAVPNGSAPDEHAEADAKSARRTGAIAGLNAIGCAPCPASQRSARLNRKHNIGNDNVKTLLFMNDNSHHKKIPSARPPGRHRSDIHEDHCHP